MARTLAKARKTKLPDKSIGQAIDQAIRFHRIGRTSEASALYEQVLQIRPRHFAALHLLGVVRQQQDNSGEALWLIDAALRIEPRSADALSNRGVALRSLNRLDEALVSFEAALAIDPRQIDAHVNRASILLVVRRFEQALQSSDKALALNADNRMALAAKGEALFHLGRSEEALPCFEMLLILAPGDVETLRGLAMISERLGRFEAARHYYDEVLARAPDRADALSGRGQVLSKLDQPERALADFDRVVALRPDDADAFFQRGLALGALERCAPAFEDFDRALSLAPQRPDIQAVHGTTLMLLERSDEALASLDKALAADPNNLVGLNNKGKALHQLGRYVEAIACFDRVLELCPDRAGTLSDRGVSLAELDRFEDALAHQARAIRIEPHSALAHVRRGNVLVKLARMEEALASFNQAVALESENPDANFNASLARLSLGDFRDGWKQYVYRWDRKEHPVPRPNYPRPIWNGENIQGKVILLAAEQGHGDTIQFIRYAPLVANLGAKVILGVHRPLTVLMQTVPGVSLAMTDGEELPHFDLYCALMSLPIVFGTELATIPANVPYIKPPDDRIAKWRDRLPEGGRLRVGICWAGTNLHMNNRRRSVSLERFARILSVPNIDFVSLQKDVGEGDPAILQGLGVSQLGSEFVDFADTAAVISLLDLVISVDTSVAHLAGAMGKAVGVLIPFSPDFRWLLDRTYTPWYPTMRLFRQSANGDWDGVIERLREELAEVSRRSPGE